METLFMSTSNAHPGSAPGQSRWGINFLFENSLFLIGGAVIALVWANLGQRGRSSFARSFAISHLTLSCGWAGAAPSDTPH
jgi:hypothetical protein